MNKKILWIVSLVIIIIVAFCTFNIYGWKMMGFRVCENPNNLILSKIDVSGNKVILNGNTAASAPSFVGYKYEIYNNNLYIGLKYNMFFNFNKRDGRFDIEIKCQESQIDKIYFKGGSTEKLIWEKKK